MLEELFNLVKSVASESTSNHPAVPAAQNDAVVAEATNTVASGLRNIVSGGGLQSLVSLLSGGNSKQQTSAGSLMSNPIVSMMIGHFAEKLMSKFKLGSGDASSVASSLIPNVINGLVHKTNDPGNSSFSLDNLLNSITGGKAAEVAPQQSGGGGLQDILNQISGGAGGNGGGLSDIISKLASGAQAQQQQNGGGGLMDLIKGFIK